MGALEQFWPQFWLLTGFLEWKNYQKAEEIVASPLPGDLGFDPLGLKPKKAEDLKVMQAKELNNGRLAMLASAGIIAQELVTGKKNLLEETFQIGQGITMFLKSALPDVSGAKDPFSRA